MKPDVTFVLARVLGPLLIAAGVMLITQTTRIVGAMMGIMADDAELVLAGFLSLTIGLGLIVLHQRWNSFSAILISILGWAFLARGVMALFAPQFLHAGAQWILSNPNVLPIVGCVAALLGVWLSYAGYIAGTLRVEIAGGELGDPRR
ncbi:MAG TPA: hypothetical protein PLS69_07345 [Terricaulis sp.]|nr:hypothetical protein [Terricaulis sp.]HRP11568.1 hypothetical protein [Terricaulis sp.]